MNKLISHFFPASNTQRFDDVLAREGPVVVGAPAPVAKVVGKTFAREFQVSQERSVQDRVDITFDSYNLMESGNCGRLAACPVDMARQNLRLTASSVFSPQQPVGELDDQELVVRQI